MSERRPLDDILRLIADLPAPDADARHASLDRLAAQGAFGRIAELAGWLASWRSDPRVRRPILALYVSAHAGSEGDSSASAQARLERLAAGGGLASLIARAQGAGVEVFDLALARPSPDAAQRPAMSERECAATIAFGMEALAKEPDLLMLSDAAEGSARAAAALALALFGGAAADWAEPSQAAWVEATAARARQAGASAPLGMLAQIGGREVAALAGAVLAARVQRTPVLIDGYAAAAACAVLDALDPDALAHVRVGHAPQTPGCARLLDRLGLKPLIDVELTEGEGAGAVAALSLVKLAGDVATL